MDSACVLAGGKMGRAVLEICFGGDNVLAAMS